MKIRSRNHSTIDRVILYIFIKNKKTERLGFKMEIDHLHLLIQLFYSEKSGLQSSDRGSLRKTTCLIGNTLLWRARFRSGVYLTKLATYRSAVAFKIHSNRTMLIMEYRLSLENQIVLVLALSFLGVLQGYQILKLVFLSRFP